MSESKPSPDAQWFGGGLRFECQPDCHKCCTRDGIVALKTYPDGRSEERAIADYLGITPRAFAQRHVKSDKLNGRYMEDSPESCSCPMWKDGCSIYPVRPAQCSTYPFWPEVVRSESAWKKEASFCPGIGKGKLHSAAAIRRRVAASGGDR